MKLLLLIIFLIPSLVRANMPLKIPGFIPDFYDLKQTAIDNAYRRAGINPEEGTAWASPKEWARKAAEDEVGIMMRNPMWVRYSLAPLWDKKYEYSKNGKLSLIHYYGPKGELFWTDHLIGTGSGNFQLTGMTGGPGGTWNPGDRALIHPGTYTNFQITVHNMNGITIINDGINFTGPVIISGTAWYVGGNTNCTFTGTGDIGTPYGFQITGTANDGAFNLSNFNIGCNFDHVWVHDMTNGPLILNGALTNLIYDGVNSNTKLLLRCNFSFFLIHGHTGGILGIFGNDFKDVSDSTTFTHWTFDSTTAFQLITGGSNYRDTVSYFLIGQIVGGGTADHGMFENNGDINFHHNIRNGQNWGWFSRNFIKFLNTTGDVYIYSNINNGNISYGFCEGRIDTTGGGSFWLGTPGPGNPRLQPGRMWVINNTCGNMKNTNNYFTPVFISYGWTYTGYDPYVVNNLRYHSDNTRGGGQDSGNITDFGSVGHPIVNQNKYIADPIASGWLNDTSTTWMPKFGTPIVGTGNPFFTGVAPTDYNSLAWGGTPDIGAVKFVSNTSCGPNCLPNRKYGKKSN